MKKRRKGEKEKGRKGEREKGRMENGTRKMNTEGNTEGVECE